MSVVGVGGAWLLAGLLAFAAAGCEGQVEAPSQAVSSGMEVEPVAGCYTDADCRTFSDYCTGCDCRALLRDDEDPVCDKGGVQCFVDPCFASEAFCYEGRCALRPICEAP